MKLVSLLSRLSLAAVSAFVFALVLNQHALAVFAVAVSSLLLLVAARDYAPRARGWQPRLAPVNHPASRSTHPFRLAA